MFRSFRSKDRSGKVAKPSRTSKKGSFTEHQKTKLQQKLDSPVPEGSLVSPIISMVIRDGRIFSAHEDTLSMSPFFARILKDPRFRSTKRVALPDEEAEVLAAVLEFLYTGEYEPYLVPSKTRNSYKLERSERSKTLGGHDYDLSTIYHSGAGGDLLRDTAVYCAGERYGLEGLKRLALKKQGLHSDISVALILRSARFAYEHTPPSDDRIRSSFLGLIVKGRKTFKRSGTMQMEMERGGTQLFFDLFVTMCTHVDQMEQMVNKSSPRTI